MTQKQTRNDQIELLTNPLSNALEAAKRRSESLHEKTDRTASLEISQATDDEIDRNRLDWDSESYCRFAVSQRTAPVTVQTLGYNQYLVFCPDQHCQCSATIIVNSRFLQRPQKRSRGNQLIHRRLSIVRQAGASYLHSTSFIQILTILYQTAYALPRSC